jgi:hypothetical protein
MDETYIKAKGEWMYLYRAVAKEGNTIDFMFELNAKEPSAGHVRIYFLVSRNINIKCCSLV